MSNEIIHGDCITAMKAMRPKTARLVVADPPYYNVLRESEWDTQWTSQAEYVNWSMLWIKEAMRLLVPGGLLYCFGQTGKREHVFIHLMSKASSVYAYHDLIIWDRVVGYNDRGDSFTPAYEMALVLRKDGGEPLFDKDAVREPYDKATIKSYMNDRRYKNLEARLEHLNKGKKATNLWRVPSLKGSTREKCGHPSQKPLALIDRIVRSSSAPGDLVLDPFVGSGTTSVIAHRLGRRCLGIERSEEYVAMARERLAHEEALQSADTIAEIKPTRKRRPEPAFVPASR